MHSQKVSFSRLMTILGRFKDLFAKTILMTAQRYLCLSKFITKESINPVIAIFFYAFSQEKIFLPQKRIDKKTA